MPLRAQPDDGFGAVARSFKDAADQLNDLDAKIRSINHPHLPVNYLYRHAIELFLKSIIVVVHRALRLSRDDQFDPVPQLEVAEKLKPIYTVHGLRDLFNEVRRLLIEHEAAISKRAQTDWSSLPNDLEKWIDTIEQADPASTAFRYPLSPSPKIDAAKSSFKEIDSKELARRMRDEPSKQFGLLLVDNDDNVVRSFTLDDDPMPEVVDALVQASKLLKGAQFGLIMELGTAIVASPF